MKTPPDSNVASATADTKTPGPKEGPASVSFVSSDHDGEADSLGISLSSPLSLGAAESIGARVSAPEVEVPVPDGEQATSAAPRASNMTIRLSIWSPPGITATHSQGRRGPRVWLDLDRTGDDATVVRSSAVGGVAGESHSSRPRRL
jgi:hypothetical protein